MSNNLQYIVDQIGAKNPIHYKKLKKTLSKLEEDYLQRAEAFLEKYKDLLKSENKTLDYAIECYLNMLGDFAYEGIRFAETGEYAYTSFEEVNERVYDNPEVMEYHMHGLLLSQFLWKHHYDILMYFKKSMTQHSEGVKTYLEIGGGHGLFLSEAMDIIGGDTQFSLVDISKTSIDIAKRIIDSDKVDYILTDIFDYHPDEKYDFITMGEVLEHVEEPIELLKKVRSLLKPGGKLFMTTPTNAPSIDHIYLFRNADEIREVITASGFSIIDDMTVYTEDVSKEIAERFKITMMYAGLLSNDEAELN